jgi:hypothetical protein
MHYFPDPDDQALQPFTRAFVRMMFAHAAFERRASEIARIITGDPQFENRWSADDRPEKMEKIIKEKYRDGLPEMDGILSCLKRSIALCHQRNLLAHGYWWEFDVKEGSITVRADRNRPAIEQHQTFTVSEIERTANTLDDLEVELWKLQRSIEARSG